MPCLLTGLCVRNHGEDERQPLVVIANPSVCDGGSHAGGSTSSHRVSDDLRRAHRLDGRQGHQLRIAGAHTDQREAGGLCSVDDGQQPCPETGR